MPTTDNPRELALLRLVAHGLVSPRPAAPEHIVERLLCLQAQDYWSGVASVIVRGAASRTEVEATFNTGAVVRAWPLRGTLHLVRAGDLPWLRQLLAPRELAAAARREDRLGITAGVLGRAERIAIELLSARRPGSRAELTAAWRSRGIDTSGPRAYHLIWHLAHTGLLCFGPVREGQQLLVLDQTWLPPDGPAGSRGCPGEARLPVLPQPRARHRLGPGPLGEAHRRRYQPRGRCGPTSPDQPHRRRRRIPPGAGHPGRTGVMPEGRRQGRGRPARLRRTALRISRPHPHPARRSQRWRLSSWQRHPRPHGPRRRPSGSDMESPHVPLHGSNRDHSVHTHFRPGERHGETAGGRPDMRARKRCSTPELREPHRPLARGSPVAGAP